MARVDVSGPGKDDLPAMESAVEAELAAFDLWFSTPISDGGGGNSSLMPQEKAILKTYLIARLAGKFSSPPGAPGTSDV